MLTDPLPLTLEGILLFDALAAIAVVYFERRDFTNVTPWLVTVAFVPVVGFIIYMFFGFHYFKSRQFGSKVEADRRFLAQVVKEQELGLDERNLPDEDPEVAPFLGMARMLLANNDAVLTQGNRVDIYTDGKELFGAIFDAMEAAEHHIHVEYYLIRNDDLGKKFLEVLGAKAREGVQVRFLYDDLGRHLHRRHFRDLEAAGGRASGFYRAPLPFGPRMNYRNHRKILVVDGRIGFLGGFNIGEEYLGKGPLGYWRDSAVRIQGDGVKALQGRFILDWNFATKEDLRPTPEYFPKVRPPGHSIAQIVSSGPDTRWHPTKEQYLRMFNIARKYIYIQTPYFIPDESTLDALRIAAMSGVDVRIMYPCKPDHPLVYWATRSYIQGILEAGARAYTYDNGFIHAKTVTVDDLCTSIGTANVDIRSFKWDFETNAVVYDDAMAKAHRRIFEGDMRQCTQVTMEDFRRSPVTVRFKEQFSRLFASAL